MIDFNTLLLQARMIRKMDRLRSIIQMIPGLACCYPPEALQIPDSKRTEAIILSMTPAERTDPDLLDGERKRRVASGSGTSVDEVSHLV